MSRRTSTPGTSPARASRRTRGLPPEIDPSAPPQPQLSATQSETPQISPFGTPLGSPNRLGLGLLSDSVVLGHPGLGETVLGESALGDALSDLIAASSVTPVMATPATETPAERSKSLLELNLKRLHAAQISLKSVAQKAANAARGFGNTGDASTKAAAELALRDYTARFDAFAELVRASEELLPLTGLGDADEKMHQDTLAGAYEAESEQYVRFKTAIDKSFQQGKNKMGATEEVSPEKLFKIPTLNVPTFDGNMRNYPRFKKGFNDMIGKSKLKDSQKLIHLRHALKGEVADAVICCGDGDDAYREAWQILDGRYGDKEVLRPMLISELQDAPATTNQHPVREQRKGHDKIRSLFQKLASIDDQADKAASPLLPMIQAKYSSDIRREIERDKGSNITPTIFLDSAEAILRRELKFSATESKKSVPKKSTASFAATQSQQAQAPEVVAAAAAVNKKAQGKGEGQKGGGAKEGKTNGKGGKSKAFCIYCEKPGHYVRQCFAFKRLEIEPRRKAAKEKNWCYRCLNKRHAKGEACPRAQAPCTAKTNEGAECGSLGHHTLLHQ